ncbi:hypothetical protein [Aureivirga sp. CE67]|uniref:hypothetical protein n=1 Tax=Aureivirga sp. CE67 TaxID=1788983 RepID=UPI0018C97705|nr:hypothetical protein [Aureivirga sp. CE67]
MKRQILVLIFLFLTVKLMISQNLQNGLIIPQNRVEESEELYLLPKNGFTVYNKPNGERIGIISRDFENLEDEEIYFINNKGERIDLSNEYFEEIGNEELVLKYWKRKNGFLRILDSRNEYWIKESEVKNKNFKASHWDIFLKYLNYPFYAKEPGLNVRQDSNINAEKFFTLKSDLHEITEIIELDKLWAKVKIKIYKIHPCESDLSEEENIIGEFSGWIKLLDDSGKPNVYFYSRGC